MPARSPDIAAAFAGARVVVTGGLGFIGSNLAIRLVELGADVLVVDSLFPAYGGNRFNIAPVEDRVRVQVADVRDDATIRSMVRDQDYVFNLAGQTSHLDSMIDPITDLEINGHAQLSILEACRASNPRARIVFASTRQVYGRPQTLPVSESHPLQPVDINGVNKLAAEFYHRLYWDVYGIPACVLRLTNTIGPRMRVRDARQTFLGLWIRAVLENRPFEVWGGNQQRDFTYVDDAVDALLLAAQPAAVGLVMNVGGTTPVSLLELARLLVQVNGGNGCFEVRDFPAVNQAIDIGSYYGDASLIREKLGWQLRTDLATALRHTLDYFHTALPHYV